MKPNLKLAVVALALVAAQSHAGIVSGSFASSELVPTTTLTPGQVYTITATANSTAGQQVQLN